MATTYQAVSDIFRPLKPKQRTQAPKGANRPPLPPPIALEPKINLVLDRLFAHAAQLKLFHPGQRVGVAVSGGADSVFLLHALHHLAPRWNLHLSVIHIEHGIRAAASKADAEFVRYLASQYGLPFHLHEAHLQNADGNLEQEARRTRHAFFRTLIQDGSIDNVATGHTRSDQAETVMFRILRGSGSTGLAGILPQTEDGLIRSLLIFTRQEIRAWLTEHGLKWREDATNQDLTLQRNRIRNQILPDLAAQFNPNLEDALANLATLAHDEEAYWNQILPKLPPSPLVFLNTTDVSNQPALGRRLLRQAIAQVKGDLRQIEFAHIERLLQMASQTADGHDRAILPGIDAMRSFNLLRLVPPGYDSSRIRDYSFHLDSAELETREHVAGPVKMQVLRLADDMQACATVKEKLDWQRLIAPQTPQGTSPGLMLRNWRPGDQYCRIGRDRAEKIKQMFQEYRIPLWERHEWPVLTLAGKIVWSKKFGPAADFAADAVAPVLLSIRETNESE
jgi:tRNA(Ile)-lysidine synthase